MHELEEGFPDAFWILRKHHPVGAYYPVGQLDGDCKCGRGEWPCEQAVKALKAYGFTPTKEAKAEGWDEAVQGLAWCLDQPLTTTVNAMDYVRHHNPYKEKQ
jgi:hypothetical protein